MAFTFTAQKQIIKLIGSTVRFIDADGKLLLRADQKGFRLKEEVHFYGDEEKTALLFSLKARSIVDISAVYDVFDAQGNVVVSMKRSGIASFFVADKWQILDAQGTAIGYFEESNKMLAILRRYIDMVSLFSPQHFEVYIGDSKIGELTQNYNPLTLKLQCSFDEASIQQHGTLFMYAIPALIVLIEGRQG